MGKLKVSAICKFMECSKIDKNCPGNKNCQTIRKFVDYMYYFIGGIE